MTNTATLPGGELEVGPGGPARGRSAYRRPRHPRQVAMERAFGGLLRGGERLFAGAGLFLFSAALLPTLLVASGASVGTGEGNPVLRAVYGLVQAGSLLLVAVYWRDTLPLALRNKGLVALVTLAILSTLWSAAPDITSRRAVALLGTSFFGLYLAARYDARSLLKLLAVAIGVAAVLSFIFGLVFPAYGIHQQVHAGAWRGVFPQKNGLGQMMVLGAIVFLLLASKLERRRLLAWAGGGLCVLLVLLSTSKTALAVLVTCLVLVPLLRTLRLHYTLSVPLLIGCVLLAGGAAVWLAANAEALLVSMGRDPTLTGRTPMWRVLGGMIMERPFVGYGYSAFWLGRQGPSARVLAEIDWASPHAHNGFLDLTLQLGLVGLGIFVYILSVTVSRAVKDLRAARSMVGLWPLLFLGYLLLYNATESTLLQQNNIFWVLFVAVAFSAGRQASALESAAVAPDGIGEPENPIPELGTLPLNARRGSPPHALRN